MDTTAVLLLQMGGPDSLDAVEPFLLNLFTDRDIIRMGPAFLQPIIARMIVKRRAPRVREQYRQIGGKSPLRELTLQQAATLEAELGPTYHCFVAMRYWKPDTLEALAAIRTAGINRVIALSLYPHYSRATSGSSFNELQRIAGQLPHPFTIRPIEHFYNHPGYIAALSEQITKGLATFPDPQRVSLFFSAHSLPQSFIDSGDPYLDHIQTTVRLVMEQFSNPHHLAFQSRAGPVKWLEPATEVKLAEIASQGCQEVLMIPLSFVSDHIETLYEIDVEYGEKAHHMGIGTFRRMESLNSTPTFIRALADLVRQNS